MNSLEQFLNTLLAELDDLPVYVTENTKEYYESYFLDAKEEGLSDLDILEKLGDPASIASQIKLDYYLYQPKQTNQVFKRLFKGVFSKTALTTTKLITGIITFIFAAIFYIVQLALVISGIGVIAAIIYVLYVDYNFVMASNTYLIITAGLVGLSVCMLFSVFFKAISFWFRKMTVNLIRQSDSNVKRSKTKKFKPAILIYTIIFIVSAIFTVASPVSKDLFYIWISETPETYEVFNNTVDDESIQYINIETLQANVNIYFGDVEDIQITYEKATYMNFDYYVQDNTVYIKETSNGDIPYLEEFFSRHEGTLDLNIVLPYYNTFDVVSIHSKGSNIYIDGMNCDLEIITEASSIDIGYIGEYEIEVYTKRGDIIHNGEYYGNIYDNNSGAIQTIYIETVSSLVELIEVFNEE